MLNAVLSKVGESSKPCREKRSALEVLAHLSHDIKSIRAEGALSIHHIQDLAERVFRGSMLADKRINQLSQERDQINRYVNSIWNMFEGMVGPLWKVNEELMPVYEELAGLHRDLEVIEHQGSSMNLSDRHEKITRIQEQLNQLENRVVVDGKVVPRGWSKMGGQIPEGQAVVTTLMNRCYKLAHHLLLEEPDVDPSLALFHRQLQHIVSELMLIRGAPDVGLKINPYELSQLQEELDQIDSQQKDGKFVDDAGNVLPGQAKIRDLLEHAYDLVNDCLVAMEDEEGSHRDSLSLLQSLGERLLDAQDTLWSYAKSTAVKTAQMSQSTLGHIRNTLAEGSTQVRELLKTPEAGLSRATSKVAALSRLGFARLSRLYAEYEPVDDALVAVKDRLETIRSSLLDMRNVYNREMVKKRSMPQMGEGSIAARKEAFTKLLEDLHGSLDDVDKSRVSGDFVTGPDQEVKSGQDHLRALLDECFCLVFELKDRLAAQ